MDDERDRGDRKAGPEGAGRQREAQGQYERAQQSGSVEGERAALQTLNIQTMQNEMEQLKRRVTKLEEELTALKGPTS